MDSEKILSLLNNSQKTKLDKFIRNALYVAKEAKPLIDFVRLIELNKAKGFDIIQNYNNIFASKDFFSCISDVEKQNMKEKIVKITIFFQLYLMVV